MVVAKISSSGNGVVFIDERGFMYVIGRVQLKNFLENGDSQEFRVLNLIPARAKMNYYPDSKVFTDEGNMFLKDAVEKGYLDKNFALSVNPLFNEEEKEEKKEDEKKQPVSDVKVDW